MAVWIETDECNGCRRCAKACPYGAVEVEEDVAVLNDRCTGCGACIASCKHDCIKTDVTDEAPDLSGWRGVLVFAEQRDGVLHPVVAELLGCASGLCASCGEALEAVLIGRGIRGLADEILRFGAGTVHCVEGEELADYATVPYTRAVADLIAQRKPSVVLFGATHIGRDLAPRVARRLGVGLTADCTELSIDPESGHLRQTRPAFGGNVIATILSQRTRPQMATVRPGVMAPCPAFDAAPGEVLDFTPAFDGSDFLAKTLEKVKVRRTGRDIRDARIIVAGGRGVGSAEGFEALRELAGVLGAEVAGTRVAVELGWIPAENQVGQTGHTVRPELYVACGISGAVQHAAGMQNAGTIVAVNRDPAAPIFAISDIGIVGDLHVVLPEIVRVLREEMA
jgi:electron transfer flavoprotein alpha subunit